MVEAIVKDLATKQALFGELDTLCSARAVLASNTSSLLPSALAERTSHPERLLVVHYFFPAHLLPAVEVVPGPRTSRQTVETAARMLRRVGRLRAGPWARRPGSPRAANGCT